MTDQLRVLLEIGPKGKRIVAAAMDWPGLERWGRTEHDAVDRLHAYVPRYVPVAERVGLRSEFERGVMPRRPTSYARGAGRQMTMSDQPSANLLREFTATFNRRDLDAVMSYFTDDAVFESPRGPDPWGTRFAGKSRVREGLAARFAGLPELHYGNDQHFVVGNRGASEWTLTGTTPDGEHIEVRGCDLWTFRDGLIAKKDSFWKIRVG